MRELGAALRKLARPSSLPLVAYLLLLLPLSGFGLASVLTQGIAIPPFITGELAKSPLSNAVLIVFYLLLAALNVRLSLTVPVFTLTDATGAAAARASWRLTRGWRSWLPLILAVPVVLIAGALCWVPLLLAAIAPTALTDLVAPGASITVAAYSLGAAQVVGMLLSGLVFASIWAILLAHLHRHADRLPQQTPLRHDRAVKPASRIERGRRPALLVTGLAVVAALGFGTAGLGTMQQISEHPSTLVLGHRGFSSGGAENTIGGLEAATAVGADLVEMDVLQTKDEKFVVMHDADLSRLAGRGDRVADLTQAELTQITVRDQFGHEGAIPTLEEYVTRADELGMPLLIELKLGGLDTDDYVDLLVDELDRIGAADHHIFHTLDHAYAERLKMLRPDAAVGYILPFAGGGVPQTSADFIVVEQASATESMQRAAREAGLGFFTWTINDEGTQRDHLRRNVDGLISDRPDTAIDSRTEMSEETGLAGALLDMVTRFVRIV